MVKKVGVLKVIVLCVLLGKGYVSDVIKESVFKVIEEMGYWLNLLVRNLVINKFECIGLVVINILYNGSYFNEILF